MLTINIPTRRILLLPLLILASATLAHGQGANPNNSPAAEEIKREILKVEDERNQAMLNKDTAALERMYDDDIAWTNPSGEVLNKARSSLICKPESRSSSTSSMTRFEMTVHGLDMVVVTGRSTSALQYKDKVSRNIERRFLNVYQKRDGQWKLIVHQQTPVATP